MNKVGKAEILKIGEGAPVFRPDLIAVEEPLEIRIGFGKEGKREQRSYAWSTESGLRPTRRDEISWRRNFIFFAYNDHHVITRQCVSEPTSSGSSFT